MKSRSAWQNIIAELVSLLDLLADQLVGFLILLGECGGLVQLFLHLLDGVVLLDRLVVTEPGLLEICGGLVQLFLHLLDGVVLPDRLVVTELRVLLEVCGGLVQLFLRLLDGVVLLG